jgi:hypothetical protein
MKFLLGLVENYSNSEVTREDILKKDWIYSASLVGRIQGMGERKGAKHPWR